MLSSLSFPTIKPWGVAIIVLVVLVILVPAVLNYFGLL